jgi:hypothetical protein
MARIIMDGFHKVWSVPTIANIAAPTTAELNAGLNLGTDLLSKEGVQGFEPDTAEVDTSAMGSLYGTNEPGLMAMSKGGLQFLANPQATEVIRPLFVRGYTTNIVIRRNGKLDTAAWASTDWLEVWPIKCGARKDGAFASNETQKFIIEVFFYIAPNQNAVVA